MDNAQTSVLALTPRRTGSSPEWCRTAKWCKDYVWAVELAGEDSACHRISRVNTPETAPCWRMARMLPLFPWFFAE